jgi:hypothetical protein
MDNRKMLQRLREMGEEDSRMGKPIDAFQLTPIKRHTERMRAAYEIGWRYNAGLQRIRDRITKQGSAA